MDWEKLKKISGPIGGVLIFEDGKPTFVVLPYDKYKSLTDNSSVGQSQDNNFQENNYGEDNPTNKEGEIAPAAENENQGNPQVWQDDDYGIDAKSDIADNNIVGNLNKEIESLKEEVRIKEAEELLKDENG